MKTISLLCLGVSLVAALTAKTPVPDPIEHELRTIALAVEVYQHKTKTLPEGGSAEIMRTLLDSGILKWDSARFAKDQRPLAPDGRAYVIIVNPEGVCTLLPSESRALTKCFFVRFSKSENGHAAESSTSSKPSR